MTERDEGTKNLDRAPIGADELRAELRMTPEEETAIHEFIKYHREHGNPGVGCGNIATYKERAAPAAPSSLSDVAAADLRRDVLWREREQELTRALRAALYEEGHCNQTTDGELLPPDGHAGMYTLEPCWVCLAWAALASAASVAERPPSPPEIASELNQGACGADPEET